jgi:GDPmannose 4,6-dehydratase
MKKALITGINGQDSAYLTKYLLGKGYQVFGTYRLSTSSSRNWRLNELGINDHENLKLVPYELTDFGSTIRMLENIEPDEIYNLAAQSFVGASFDQPRSTAEVNAMGPINLLEAIRTVNKAIRFYQASTSEMFGKARATPQNEETPFYPRSPYAVAKLYAHWITINYREAYDLFSCSGILFNHESPLRGTEFVTRKITNAVARIKLGLQKCVELGNLDVKRDWGFAADYVKGMYLMLQADKADDYVLATNKSTSIRDFATISFKVAGIELDWQGEGQDEVAINRANGETVVKVNSKFYRPAEVHMLRGDATKAKKQLGWESKLTLNELCAMMVEADLKRNAKSVSDLVK